MNKAVFIERRAARILQNAKDDPKTAPTGMRWINLAIDRVCHPFRDNCDLVLMESLLRMRDAIHPYALKAQEEAGR